MANLRSSGATFSSDMGTKTFEIKVLMCEHMKQSPPPQHGQSGNLVIFKALRFCCLLLHHSLFSQLYSNSCKHQFIYLLTRTNISLKHLELNPGLKAIFLLYFDTCSQIISLKVCMIRDYLYLGINIGKSPGKEILRKISHS